MGGQGSAALNSSRLDDNVPTGDFEPSQNHDGNAEGESEGEGGDGDDKGNVGAAERIGRRQGEDGKDGKKKPNEGADARRHI
jgi:hypothetical protein